MKDDVTAKGRAMATSLKEQSKATIANMQEQGKANLEAKRKALKEVAEQAKDAASTLQTAAVAAGKQMHRDAKAAGQEFIAQAKEKVAKAKDDAVLAKDSLVLAHGEVMRKAREAVERGKLEGQRQLPPRRRSGVRAAAALLLVSAGGCQIGHDRLDCTLDPAAIQLPAQVAPVCAPTGTLAGVAFEYGRCGVPCPPPWTVRVTWRNLATGEAGEVIGTYRVSGCWPFAATSCQGASWSIDVPLAPGLNRLELEADQGDGFTACRAFELERLAGCP